MVRRYELFLVLVLVRTCWGASQKPNIIVIIADDMGFNDVGFHGSDEIPTPNIDALAYNGVILNTHYTQALCTPSRAAFLTGKYPIHTGMQQLVILETEPWGLPLNETIMPQYLKKNGYSTHAVGKWHLGFFKKEYTPTYRGFDTHYGYWQGLHDYYTHMTHSTYGSEKGYDMRRNMEPDYSAKGKYSTTLFTEESVRLIREHDTEKPMFLYLSHLAPHSGNDDDPLQAPDEEIAKFEHIQDPERRIYAAMVSMLDQSVGTVISALREKHMLENSIVLFISDNGANPQGIHANHGSNFPFRGVKNSAWEGAHRGVATIWSPLIEKNQRVSNHMMHLSDWLPTFYSAAGLDKNDLPPDLDGLDMWAAISEGGPGQRTDLLYNIDDVNGYGALRQGKWKYVYGSTSKGRSDGWYGDAGTGAAYRYDVTDVLASKVNGALAGLITYRQVRDKNDRRRPTVDLIDDAAIRRLRSAATVTCAAPAEDQLEATKCDLTDSPCLFDIVGDPCERTNLASLRPNIAANLERAVVRMRATALAPRNVPADPRANPARWGGAWTDWADREKGRMSPLAVGLVAVAGVLVVGVVGVLLAFSLRRRCRGGMGKRGGGDKQMHKEAARMIGGEA